MKLPQLKEWQRTIVLVVLLLIAAVIIVRMRTGYDQNFTDTF